MNYRLFIIHTRLKSKLSLYFVLLIQLLFLSNNLFSQEQINTPVEGILGKSGALDETAWSFFTNSAGLSNKKSITAGLGYANDYNLKELSSRSLFVVVPTKLIVVSGGFVHQGFEKFNTQHYNIALSRKMAPWLNLSIRPHFIIRHQEQLDDLMLFTLDAGFQLFPSDKVKIGFFIDNPAQSKWTLHSEEQEYHPTIVRSAFSFAPSSNVDMELGVFKQDNYKTHISYALIGQLHKYIVVRGVVSSSPIRFALGMGVEWQGINFDVGLNHHTALGISSAFGITYSFSKNKKAE